MTEPFRPFARLSPALQTEARILFWAKHRDLDVTKLEFKLTSKGKISTQLRFWRGDSRAVFESNFPKIVDDLSAIHPEKGDLGLHRTARFHLNKGR